MGVATSLACLLINAKNVVAPIHARCADPICRIVQREIRQEITEKTLDRLGRIQCNKQKIGPFEPSQLQVQPLPTPINHEKLGKILDCYDPVEREFLINGFKFGFRIPFKGKKHFMGLGLMDSQIIA